MSTFSKLIASVTLKDWQSACWYSNWLLFKGKEVMVTKHSVLGRDKPVSLVICIRPYDGDTGEDVVELFYFGDDADLARTHYTNAIATEVWPMVFLCGWQFATEPWVLAKHLCYKGDAIDLEQCLPSGMQDWVTQTLSTILWSKVVG